MLKSGAMLGKSKNTRVPNVYMHQQQAFLKLTNKKSIKLAVQDTCRKMLGKSEEGHAHQTPQQMQYDFLIFVLISVPSCAPQLVSLCFTCAFSCFSL